jgi:Concanavalin A-like lectin/glucanases superfamily
MSKKSIFLKNNLIITLCLLQLTALAKTANITIENKYTKQIVDDASYKSINMPRIGEAGAFFKTPKSRKAITQLFKDYGFKAFRCHNPNISFWNHPINLWSKFIRDTYSKKHYTYVIPDKEYIKWLHKNNFKASMQLNNKLYYDPIKKRVFRLDKHPEYIQKAAQYAAEFVRWVKDNGYKNSILYWELGNESYNKGGYINDLKMEGFTPQEIAKIDFAYIRAMRKVDPAIKIAVDGQSPEHPGKRKMKAWSGTAGQWHRQFLTALVKLGIKDGDIDFISQHCYAHWINDVPFNYPEQAPPAPEKTWNLFKQPVITQIGSVEANVALLKSLGLNNVKIEVNEFKRGASHMWYNRTMMHALAQADPLFYFIKNPKVSGAVIHSLFNNGKYALHDTPWKLHTLGWGIFIPTPDGGFIASPIAVMYQLIDKLLKSNDKILKISGGSASVAAYGNNKLKFIVVNKEDKAVSTRINLKGFELPKNTEVKIYTLKSGKLTDFPVHPITKKRIEFKVTESKINISSTAFNYTMPKYSFVLFEISGIKMNKAEKIPFKYSPKNTSSVEDAMDFYETKATALKKDEKTILYLDFANSGIGAVRKNNKKYALSFHNIKSGDFSRDGVHFTGEQYISVGKLLTPKENIKIEVLFKPEANNVNAMLVAENFHFTGVGIWGGKLYSDIKTSKGRYRFHSSKRYPVNKWLLMTLTYDGKTAKTYLNRKLIDQGNLTGKIVTSNLVIGATANQMKARFKGYIKQISISRLKP